MLLDRQSAGKIKALAYITGVYLGDGCVTRHPSYSVRFRLNTIDYDFAEHTNNALYELLGRKAKKIYVYEVKKSSKPNCSVSLGCKELCDFLEEETQQKQKIPSYVYSYNKEYLLEFTAGLMDSEGSVTIHKDKERTISIRFKSTSVWTPDFNALLQSLGAKTSLTKEPPYKPWYKEPYNIRITTKSFIKTGMYFKIKRKQDRIETLRDYMLGSGN